MPDSASVNSGQTPQLRKKAYGLYVQDTWKVTRKLTLDYGVRYDYQTGLSELHHRLSEFGPGIANPSAGGLLGGVAYEGSGAGTCNCSFIHTYPYGFGPRLGVAYQMDAKTVIRGGWGLIYGATSGVQYMSGSPMLGTGWGSVSATAIGAVAPFTLAQGFHYPDSQLHNNSHDPGIRPDPGQIDPPSYYIDPNAGRPPRINQWNISVQRELFQNLSVEVAYVGNRGAWLQADQMTDINGLSGARIAAAGLNLNSQADRDLLTSPMNSSQVIAKGFKAPYAAFPMSLTLAQALRPYPQFSSINTKWVPRGNTWYDALQSKVTKRLSKGFEASGSFTWQKELALGAMEGVGWLPVATNDVYNRGVNKFISSESQPHVLTAAVTYSTPAATSNKLVRTLVRDWTVGAAMRYASGLPIEAPLAQTSINTLLLRNVGSGTGTFDFRVPGQPLFLNSLNGSSDPNRQVYLNPKAWAEPAQGQFGGQAYYSDYRYQRRPTESLSIGRMFRVREGMSFEVRFEAFNAFNRTEKNDPDGTNSLLVPSYDANGNVQSGFGRVNTGGLYSTPRHAQMLARFRF
jgi:hypothetical protein